MDRKEISRLLNELGFNMGCIVEAIVTTRSPEGAPNLAPMGITRREADLMEIKTFKSSLTYQNLLTNPEACVNVTNDPVLFLVTAFKQEIRDFPQPLIRYDLSMESAEAAVFVKVVLSDEISDNRGCFVCRADSVEIRRNLPMAFSRGRAEAIEAVIHATRIRNYLRRGLVMDAEKLNKRLNDCKEVVRRVSQPDSAEARVIETLITLTGRWREEASR